MTYSKKKLCENGYKEHPEWVDVFFEIVVIRHFGQVTVEI